MCPSKMDMLARRPRTVAAKSCLRHRTLPLDSQACPSYKSWAALAGIGVLLLGGCWQDMGNQPKYRPLAASDFFVDGRASRDPPAGTVARGQLRIDDHFGTGTVDGKLAETFPQPVAPEMLDRGQQRFNIYCSPCHDRVGNGRGMVVQRGFPPPPSYHMDRLRAAPVGYFFDVVTNGFGRMSDYRDQISPADRWAIIAYIRALQLSQHAERDKLAQTDLEQLDKK